MLDYNITKRIQEMFRVSEVITANEEAITPIYKVRENVEKFSIKERDLKEYLVWFAPRDGKPYIDFASSENLSSYRRRQSEIRNIEIIIIKIDDYGIRRS